MADGVAVPLHHDELEEVPYLGEARAEVLAVAHEDRPVEGEPVPVEAEGEPGQRRRRHRDGDGEGAGDGLPVPALEAAEVDERVEAGGHRLRRHRVLELERERVRLADFDHGHRQKGG